MKPNRIFILQNPVAGTSNPDQVKNDLTQTLTQREIPFQLYQTAPDDDIKTLTNQAVADGFDWIWAAGGDGTVSAVANGLINKEAVMGVIPIGTGNVLARELGIPLQVRDACRTLLDNSQVKNIDAIQVEDNYYLLTVSAGVGSKTMAETGRSQKRKLGRLAYMINGLRLMLARQVWPFKVAVDGKSYRIRATEIIAANVGIIGYKILRWGKDIQPDDGQVELCYVKVNSAQAFLRALRGAALDQQDQVMELSCLSAQQEILIDSTLKLPVQGDGDPIGTTPVRVMVVPAAISILVPH